MDENIVINPRPLRDLMLKYEFKIPIFQRGYSWSSKAGDEPPIDVFWTDILHARDVNKAHFFGSLVIMHSNMNYILIDGQQRMTTMMILMRAFYEYLPDGLVEVSGDDYSEITGHDMEISEYEKVTKDENPPHYFVDYKKMCRQLFISNGEPRLSRSRNCDDQLIELLSSNCTFSGDKRRLTVQCYDYFKDKLDYESTKGERNILELFKTIVSKITIVTINLDDSEDPSIVFNSLNTTGVRLSPVSMFRNHVIMSCAKLKGNKQEDVYDKIWVPFEKKFENESKIAEFLRVYLMMACEKTVYKSELFNVLKNYYDSKVGSDKSQLYDKIESFFNDLSNSITNYNYLMGFVPYPHGSISESNIDQCLTVINSAGFKSHRCYVLKLFNTVDDIQKLSTMMSYIESYVVRRTMVQGLLNNTVDKLFVDLCKDGVYDPETLKTRLLDESFPGHWPRNDELERSLNDKDFYSSGRVSFCIKVFERMDLKMRGEKVKVQEGHMQSIEHIVPETSSVEWKKDLGPKVYDELFIKRHRLGNLTLLSIPKNSTIGRELYTIKYNNAYKVSSYMITSKLITARKKWDISRYNEHRDALIRHIEKTWPIPTS